MQRSTTTKLQELLADKTRDDEIWFSSERYLINYTGLPGVLTFVSLAGCEPADSARFFKTDVVKLRHDTPPKDVLRAWNRWRR
jgi:hypothetical protein